MNRIVIVLLLIVAATGAYTVTAHAPAEKQPTFLSALKEGQHVSLKQDAGRYEISTVEGVAAVQGYKVMEIGADYVVIQDVAGVTESRIPLWSIKAITRLKVPKR
ncbi:MAG: hypothetical protein AB7I37_06450 [Pirellulales bacterium]